MTEVSQKQYTTGFVQLVMSSGKHFHVNYK